MKAHLSTGALLLSAAAVFAQARGVVNGVTVSSPVVDQGKAVTFTATGTNPCGAVHLVYGDGNAVTHPITQLPATISHTYAKPGSYTVIAQGMGNCDGEAKVAMRVNAARPAPAAPPPPPEAAPGPLDRNRDGVIGRDEWRGDDAAFRAHDWNRDGILSGDEAREAEREAARGTRGRTPGTIVVPAKGSWTDTGLWVRAGDRVSFESRGTVQLSADSQDVADPAGARSGRRAPGAPLTETPAGALIARIGDGPPMEVGSRRTPLRAREDGRLYLAVNDDHSADNEGAFRVLVTIDRAGR